MTDTLIVVALLLVAAAATAAVLVRDPARQALVLSLLGLSLAVLFLVLQAPDVALSQLAVGSALTPLLLLLSVRKIRRAPARPEKEPARPAGPGGSGRAGRPAEGPEPGGAGERR
ncbi:hydrogenase subunit MbhD domain-containing protein [Streptomyces sp. DW26H14]|uniref:hydrogenase subunit MbhD domain-containing protein n=1 Tax=Streptomyces sp. DW26H14 TaxID=3435395 RepID=UPI00403DAF74